MSNFSEAAVKEAGGGLDRLNLTNSWRAIVPVTVTGLLALTPAPAGLAQHAWYYFAIFAGVIVALTCGRRRAVRAADQMTRQLIR